MKSSPKSRPNSISKTPPSRIFTKKTKLAKEAARSCCSLAIVTNKNIKKKNKNSNFIAIKKW